jgi:uncharacterized protein with HEPN domain
MSRDDTYLVDILESARITLDYVAGKSWDEFYQDMQCQDAVLRRTLAPHASAGVEIIGEAARHVSPQFQKKYPQIPWRDLTVLRNLVIHQYDTVDVKQVWDTTQNRLPSLVNELSKIVPPE